MNIKFTVLGQELKVVTPIILVSDSVGYLDAEFEFSSDWDGLNKWAHFKSQDGVTYNLELTENKLARLNLLQGRWSVWIHATDVTPDTPTLRITSSTVTFTVQSSGVCIDGVLPDIPLTAEERIAANAANALAEVTRLREDLDGLELSSEEARVFAQKAQLSAEAAEESEKGAEQALQNAEGKVKLSESWSSGGTGVRPGEDTDNAKYWAAKARDEADRATIPAVQGVYNFVLQDTVNGVRYAVIVEQGVLKLMEVSPSLDTVKATFVDRETGLAYRPVVESGVLKLEEVG